MKKKKYVKASKKGTCPHCKKGVQNLQSHVRIKHLFKTIKRRGKTLRRRK